MSGVDIDPLEKYVASNDIDVDINDPDLYAKVQNMVLNGIIELTPELVEIFYESSTETS